MKEAKKEMGLWGHSAGGWTRVAAVGGKMPAAQASKPGLAVRRNRVDFGDRMDRAW